MRWPSELEQRSLARAVTPDKHPFGLSARHHQVHRDTEVKRHRRCRHGEPNEDRNHVPMTTGKNFRWRPAGEPSGR